MKLSKLVRIAFEEQHLERGAEVIMRAGTVTFCGDDTVLVPEETVKLLKKKQVPFIEVEGADGSLHKVRGFRADRVQRSRNKPASRHSS